MADRINTEYQTIRAMVDRAPRVGNAPEATRHQITLRATDLLDEIGEWDEATQTILVDSRTARAVVIGIGTAYRDGIRAAYEAMQEAASAII